MAEKDTSKKSTWEKLNTEAKQETSKSTNEEKTPSAEKKKTEPEKQLTHPSYEELEAQLLITEKQLDDSRSQLAKLEEQKLYDLAEKDNIQRQAIRDVKSSLEKFSGKFISDLLPVKDSLETAIDYSKLGEKDSALSGIQLTAKQLQGFLEKNGVKSIDPTGKPFDSHFHQAMLTEENEDLAPNTIIRVLQKGYLLHERLIRPALVVVAKAKEKTS